MKTLGTKLAWIGEFVSRKRSYNTTYKALASLSDYELNDIGLSRGDIKYIARGGKPYRRTY
jgi:uncharacterized protein YjiS (DUF1127 family)